MSRLNLTPDILEAAYNYLRATPPFRRWDLPDGDQLMFRVLGTRERFGHFRGCYRRATRADDYSELAISASMVRSTDLLLATMAHEMIHLYQDENGTARGNHNPEFRRLAKAGLRHSRIRFRQLLIPGARPGRRRNPSHRGQPRHLALLRHQAHRPPAEP